MSDKINRPCNYSLLNYSGIHSVCQSIGYSVSQSVSHSFIQPVSQSVSQSVSQPVSQSVSQPFIQSVSLLVFQPFSQSVCQSFSLSACQSVCQSVSHKSVSHTDCWYSQVIYGLLLVVKTGNLETDYGTRENSKYKFKNYTSSLTFSS